MARQNGNAEEQDFFTFTHSLLPKKYIIYKSRCKEETYDTQKILIILFDKMIKLEETVAKQADKIVEQQNKISLLEESNVLL